MSKLHVLFKNYDDFIYDSNQIELSNSVAKLKNTGDEANPVYSTSNPFISLSENITAAKLLGFLCEQTINGNDNVRYTLLINDKEKYISGGELMDSSGYDNSNTADEINAHAINVLDTLSNFNLKIYLHSHDGSTTPEISRLTFGLTNIFTDNVNRNSFVTSDEAEKFINANIINGNYFNGLSWSDREKYLIHAYRDIISLPYVYSLSNFESLPESIQKGFKQAQIYQAYSLFMPDTVSRSIRENGIFEYSLDSEKITADAGMKYRLCPEARKLIEDYIDFSMGVY